MNQFDTNAGWIAANIYNNEVYLMDDNNSIFKVRLDALEDYYNESSQTEENDNLIISTNISNQFEEMLAPYMDQKEIKQTGTNNLTGIKFFSIISDDSVLVYDDFDNSYKLITAMS